MYFIFFVMFYEFKIVEVCDLIFYDGSCVLEFGWEVFVIVCSDWDENFIGNIIECNNFECNW